MGGLGRQPTSRWQRWGYELTFDIFVDDVQCQLLLVKYAELPTDIRIIVSLKLKISIFLAIVIWFGNSTEIVNITTGDDSVVMIYTLSLHHSVILCVMQFQSCQCLICSHIRIFFDDSCSLCSTRPSLM